MRELKFSVIICSIEAAKYARICENYKRLLANYYFEIIGIHNATSLAEGYTRGIEKSTGEILIFSHDDIIIIDDEFSTKIIDRLKKFDLIGFAGASKLVEGKWIGASNDFLHGAIAHALPKSDSLTLNIFGIQEWPVISDIKALDGLCIICNRHIFNTVKFDSITFNGFHLYDLDISFSAYLSGFKIGVCCDIPIIHESGGNFDEKYKEYSRRFEKKYGAHFDPPEFARVKHMQSASASIVDDTEALLISWQESSLKTIFKNSPPQTENSANDFGKKYLSWLAQRCFIESDTKFLELQSPTVPHIQPIFQFFIRLHKGFEGHLADTIDSLGQQIYESWHLNIFSTLPSPEGLDDVPNIDWRTFQSEDEFGNAINLVADSSQFDWLIEIPAGARLDILYLWRLAKEISSGPKFAAYFFDDDSYDKEGERHTPRFKPGTNPGYLQSSDLAGPICVRKDAWLASNGVTKPSGSPWFCQLLRIVESFGWQSIKHIPDILISYPNSFPSDPHACQLALLQHIQRGGVDGEIAALTDQSWFISSFLKNFPTVTLAILSTGQLEFVSRCISSALKSTLYPSIELLVVTNKLVNDPDFENWLAIIQSQSPTHNIRIIYANSDANHADRCNSAIAASESELVVLAREETVFVQDVWLSELVGSLQQNDITAAAPLIHKPGDAKVLASGRVIGLLGEFASPYSEKADLDEAGYLDFIKITRDITALPSSCYIIRKSAYLNVGGMDCTDLGDHFADIDLCLKLRKQNHRLIVHPRSSVVFGGETSLYDLKKRAEANIRRMTAGATLRQRWGADVVVDPYWNPNLSLSDVVPQPETEFRAQWQYLPTDKPRILAHPLGNGQGDFRIVSPLMAARKAGLASECLWRQKITNSVRYFTAAEITRLAPTTVIVQNYIHDTALGVLKDWSTLKNRPFVVYTLDDLINDLDKTNPFRVFIPPNARSRLKYALSNCDRLVVSTEFLAETYRHFISDIKVVPNRLEKDIWMPLNSLKRTSKKPRIGWAGGTTHEGDLILLKEIIEQTRNEADWIFFGMCPDDIRPLLAEYHELIPFDQYPAHLASLNIDIAVAPLAMTPFNQGKSNLRLLEYGVLGIPVVCTDIDPYQNSPACRVENTAKAWIEALRERIYDADAREREGAAMRDWFTRSYILEEHSEEWVRAHLPG
jgi:GT2 family glycosyltransferase/glycosyltransferase involved in cell wall biosynthesis